MDFKEIPILDLSLADDPQEKPQFLADLRNALLNVGFLYIKNYGISQELVKQVCKFGIEFFDLSEEDKLKCEMKNGPHFLGYNRLGTEITAKQKDYREQIDLATELPAPDPSEPRYRWLRGPNFWPDEKALPGFKQVYQDYIAQMTAMSDKFICLVAEAIGLEPNVFDMFFEKKGVPNQHKLKVYSPFRFSLFSLFSLFSFYFLFIFLK